MSKTALADVVQRAIGDAAFRRRLQNDPAGALRGFKLSADETAAVRSGDPAKLISLGIDQRISKAFALDVMSAGTASRWGGTDVSSASVDGPQLDSGTRGSTDALATGAAASERIIGDLSSARAAGIDLTGDDFGRLSVDAGEAGGSVTSRVAADPGATSGPGDAYITADDAGGYGVQNADSSDAMDATDKSAPDIGHTPPEITP